MTALITRAELATLARDNGLVVAGVTSAEPFDAARDYIIDHIKRGHTAGMPWFTVERARQAADPRTLHDRVQSIISVAVPFWTGGAEPPNDGVLRGRIARYAWGRDYHKTLKRRMVALVSNLEQQIGRPLEARTLVDTARIFDRAVAERAGTGWVGKNSMIIVPRHGSWVMLGEMLMGLDLEPDEPLDHNCGHCHICLDRCPTGAIVAPYTIHAPACLSFQTIEQQGAIPREIRPHMGDWVFGCDVCQEVCPYTNAAAKAADPEFLPPSIEHAYPALHGLLAMSHRTFRARYRGTAIARAKRSGLARNAAVALGNIGTEEDVPSLGNVVLGHDLALVRGHAAWALGRIGGAKGRRFLDLARSRERDPEARVEIELALDEAA
jgi:epoxyqueuosine reductase